MNNIIVVDDTFANLDLLEDMLSSHQYEVRSFPKGQMALSSAKSDPPDLFLLDIMMPELNGYELCQLIKEDEDLKDIPVIFISAKSEPFDKLKAFDLGGVDYITKPFNLMEVLARVNTHISLRNYQKELEEKNEQLQVAFQQLKTAQNKLVHSEKMASIGILAAGIAHEINNPVNFINISAKGLQKKLQPLIDFLIKLDDLSPEHRASDPTNKELSELKLKEKLTAIEELTSNISTGTKRAVDIVNGLRLFSRMDKAETEDCDVHNCLESTLLLLKNEIKGQIKVIKKYGELPTIEAYPGRLNQVFMNLIKNAVDALTQENHPEKEKTITIATKTIEMNKGKQVIVSVTDNGPGIKDSHYNKLFDPFFTTKDVGKGMGLGLSITMGIVENHNGKISFQSEEAIGSSFHVQLPVVQSFSQNL